MSAHQLGRDSVWFGMGSFAGKAIGLISLPFIARLLTPEEFGRLDVLNAMLSAGMVVLLLGTDVAATRLFFDQATESDRRALLSTWYLIAISIVAPVSLALVAASEAASLALFGTVSQQGAIVVLGLTLVVGVIHVLNLGVLRIMGRARPYAVLEGVPLIFNAGLVVGLLFLWKADTTTVFVALLASWAIAVFAGLSAVRSAIRARPTSAHARGLLALGLPLAPAVAASFGAEFFNRAFLLGTAGANEAASLSMGVRIASVAMLLVTAAQLAWQPRAYRLGSDVEAMPSLAVEARQIVATLSAAIVVLAIATPAILAFVGGDRYAGAAPVVGIALLGTLGTGMFLIVSLPSALARDTGQIALAIGSGVVVAVAANVFLAPALAAIGTATALACGQWSSVTVVAFLGRRRVRIPLDSRRVGLLLAMTVVVVLAATLDRDLQLPSRLAVAAVAAAIFGIEGTLPRAARSVVTLSFGSRPG